MRFVFIASGRRFIHHRPRAQRRRRQEPLITILLGAVNEPDAPGQGAACKGMTCSCFPGVTVITRFF